MFACSGPNWITALDPLSKSSETPITYSLIKPALGLFSNACKAQTQALPKSPINPICHNPDFPPGMQPVFLCDVWSHSSSRALDFFHQLSIKVRSEVPCKEATSHLPFLKYFKILHFLNSSLNRPSYPRLQTPFETLWLADKPQNHLVSQIYCSNLPQLTGATCKACENALGVTLMEKWEKNNSSTHTSSLNMNIQERCYNIWSRW